MLICAHGEQSITAESFYFRKTQWKRWLLLNVAFCRDKNKLKFSAEAEAVSGMNSLLDIRRENK